MSFLLNEYDSLCLSNISHSSVNLALDFLNIFLSLELHFVTLGFHEYTVNITVNILMKILILE